VVMETDCLEVVSIWNTQSRFSFSRGTYLTWSWRARY
jgi:hypothetical protein